MVSPAKRLVFILGEYSSLPEWLFSLYCSSLLLSNWTPCLHFGTTAGAWPSLWRPSSRASLRRRVSGPLPMHIPPLSLFQVSQFRHLREFHLRLSIHFLHRPLCSFEWCAQWSLLLDKSRFVFLYILLPFLPSFEWQGLVGMFYSTGHISWHVFLQIAQNYKHIPDSILAKTSRTYSFWCGKGSSSFNSVRKALTRPRRGHGDHHIVRTVTTHDRVKYNSNNIPSKHTNERAERAIDLYYFKSVSTSSLVTMERSCDSLVFNNVDDLLNTGKQCLIPSLLVVKLTNHNISSQGTLPSSSGVLFFLDLQSVDAIDGVNQEVLLFTFASIAQ